MPRLRTSALAAIVSTTAAICTGLMLPESAPERFVVRKMMPSGQCIVVAEGDHEPRSTGSVSVRLYGANNPDHPTDDFLCGAILPRDGSVERISFADTNRNGRQEIIIIIRSAGSGGYLSVHAIEPRTNNQIDAKHQLNLIRSLDGLASNADPIELLRAHRD